MYIKEENFKCRNFTHNMEVMRSTTSNQIIQYETLSPIHSFFPLSLSFFLSLSHPLFLLSLFPSLFFSSILSSPSPSFFLSLSCSLSLSPSLLLSPPPLSPSPPPPLSFSLSRSLSLSLSLSDTTSVPGVY